MKNHLFLLSLIPLCGFTLIRREKKQFPESWQGNWKGNCVLLQVNDTGMRFGMTLDIKRIVRDSLYDFRICYGSQEARPYHLVRGPARGQWITDERNSILLPGYYHDGHYIDLFQVDDVLIRSDFELSGKVIKVRMESWNVSKRAATGDSIRENRIWNYPPQSVQYCILNKSASKN